MQVGPTRGEDPTDLRTTCAAGNAELPETVMNGLKHTFLALHLRLASYCLLLPLGCSRSLDGLERAFAGTQP